MREKFCFTKCFLPAGKHNISLHVSSFVESPRQSPPCCASWSTTLSQDRDPPPHVIEQGPHWPQTVQVQFTEKVKQNIACVQTFNEQAI